MNKNEFSSIKADFNIRILRTSENDKSVTGEMFVNDKFICHSLEKPWQNNASYISCIPSGTYSGIIRYDKTDGWRLQFDVPDRPGIQIHVGNYPDQTQGCVLVGDIVDNANNCLIGGTSQPAYSRLRQTFYGSDSPTSSPDKVITMTIAYGTTYTTMEKLKNNNDWMELKYVKQALWQDRYKEPQPPNNWKELKRDTEYIYIFTPPFFYLKIPLHGGFAYSANSANGPWSKSDEWKRNN